MVVFGTRPEAIKLAPVIAQLQAHPELGVITVATAQHREMLDQMLDTFDIEPDVDLRDAHRRAWYARGSGMTRAATLAPMMTLRASISCVALVLLLASCGGDEPSNKTSSTAATPTETSLPPFEPPGVGSGVSEGSKGVKLDPGKVKKNGRISKPETEFVSVALNRISAECVTRRKSKEKVGRPTKQFRVAADVLIAQFKDTPDRKFKLPGQSKETTMQAVMLRVGASLAKPAPQGCGANSKKNGGTGPLQRKLRAALVADK